MPEQFKGGYGLYKSINDGQNWVKLVVPGAENAKPTDLEMDPGNSQILYAGFLGGGIFRTSDGGNTWCPLNVGIPRNTQTCPITYGLPDPSNNTFDHVQIAIDTTTTTHLYATFGNCPDRLLEDCTPSVYESSDSGTVWTRRFTGSSSSSVSVDVPCPGGYTRY